MKYACMLAMVAIASWCTPSQAHASTRVDASIDKREVGLGEHLTLMASIEHPAGSTVKWPADLGFGPSIEERGREVFAPTRNGETERSRVSFILAVYELDVDHIPGVAVTLRHLGGANEVLRTPDLAIAIQGSVDPKNAKLKPSRAPVDAPVRNWKFLLVSLAIVFVLGLLAFAILLVRRKRKPLPPATTGEVVSPHQQALQALDAIENSGRLESEDLKAVFREMSEIMRRYLGRRFSFPALDMTSSEVRSRLKSCPGSHEWSVAMNAWLGRCDLVKYAGAEVNAEEASTALYSARELVERTKEAALAQARPVEVARA